MHKLKPVLETNYFNDLLNIYERPTCVGNCIIYYKLNAFNN